ncbi:MAG TPA: glycosyltransferase family 4 protein [Candidatus Sulfotelmatobacter sp.]|nr:glycosyltransferase family 4 protein [Candidatus Sulfotelmatobacter sp.]
MTVLFGHPTGGPFSHNAALSHLEADRLEAFCVPWMPSPLTLQVLDQFRPLRPMARRFSRRYFPPLAHAPKVQGRLGELRRLIIRAAGRGDEALSYEANDWLMRTMARECRRPAVTAVHSYEDCSLSQFVEAKRLGKACIYDMPIGYYPAWERTQAELAQEFVDWLPAGGLPSNRYVRPDQKREEMELADLVLAPSSFVEETIRTFHPNKKVALAPYGVDLEFWKPADKNRDSDILRFIYAGQMSLRKGVPLLLQAWEKAALRSAELQLVGSWHLSESKRALLPRGVIHVPALSSEELRDHYRHADVFVFPSYFEGFGLVLLEAMACGLPAIASEATAGPDVLTEASGRLVPVGELDSLVAALRWFDENRSRLRAMGHAARKKAEECTWDRYRSAVTKATAGLV